MFDVLSERLGTIFSRLKGRGVLSESDVRSAMREVRRALLEADVSLDVARDFIDIVSGRAMGSEVIRSVTPGQMVIKIVQDCLTEMLGSEFSSLELKTPPSPILMVGLQGSGKTTSSVKLGRYIRDHLGKRVLLVSLDVHRPAAREQLSILCGQGEIDVVPIVASARDPILIASHALEEGRKGGYDAVIFDSAGRGYIDDVLMDELSHIRDTIIPHETLLVADSLTGQAAVDLACSFNDRIGLSGIILTRIDGDGRGGAALSMRAVTGKPIKFIGTGEKLDDFEIFHPERLAGRILGMGDVVSLVEKAADLVEEEEALRLADKMRRGSFNLDDFASQLRQMGKIGGLSGILGLMPGARKLKNQMDSSGIDDGVLKRQIAIIESMTPFERRHPKVLNASRKRRISGGSGIGVPEINRLLKSHRQMSDMMKRLGKSGDFGTGLLNRLFGDSIPDISDMGLPAGSVAESEKGDGAGSSPASHIDIGKLLNTPSSGGGFPGLGGGGGSLLPGLGGTHFPPPRRGKKK